MGNAVEPALVFNIQWFCLHDGDGIRTTFFFKGCPLRCVWCHNPEGMDNGAQTVFYQERCRRCGLCDGDGCRYGAREVAGTPYTPEKLIQIAERDAPFYKSSGGGVTLSGGEVMAQPLEFLLPLTRGLKQKGIHLAIDTCGQAPFETFEMIRPYTDEFLYDIKLIDRERHIRFTGQDNGLILSNLPKLSDTGAAIDVRVPVIEGVNADDADMNAIIAFLSQNVRAERVTLLPYHNVGGDKYRRLGLAAPSGFCTPNPERMRELVKRFRENGLPAEQQEVSI